MSVEKVDKRSPFNEEERNNLVKLVFGWPFSTHIYAPNRKKISECCDICNHGTLDTIISNDGFHSHIMTYHDDTGDIGEINLILKIRLDGISFHVDLVHCSSLENLKNFATGLMGQFSARFIFDAALVMTTNFPDCVEKLLKNDYLIRSFSTNTKKRAVLIFTDNNEYVVYSTIDCMRLSRHLNSDNVIVMKIPIVNITKETVDIILHNLRSMGVEKIMIYYTGCGRNIASDVFPTLFLKNMVQLNHTELDNMLTSKGFDLTIIGYDCSNVQKMHPISRSKDRGSGLYIDDLIFEGTGKITFCAASVGYDAFADNINGGWYTKEWVERALSGNFENFVSVIESIKEIEKTLNDVDYTMVPYFVYE